MQARLLLMKLIKPTRYAMRNGAVLTYSEELTMFRLNTIDSTVIHLNEYILNK